MFGFIEESEKISSANFTYQVWNFCICFIIPEFYQPDMLCHHMLSAFATWYSVHYNMLHYYGVFFSGMSEVSTIFLAIIDASQYFPPSPGSFFSLLVTICQPLFVVTFVYYRVYLWWKMTYNFLNDLKYVISDGQVAKFGPGCTLGLYFEAVISLVLGFLQIYWLGIILQKVVELFT